VSERSPRILVVDDEPAIRRSCVKILTRMDYTVETAGDGREALERITADPADVVITDLKMSRMGGMELLREVREHYPETMVIVITGYASVSSSVEVMKTGAFDYLPKPFTPHELRSVVVQALSERDRIVQNRRLRRQPEQQTGRGGGVKHQLIGDSPKIKTVVSMVGKVAPTDATVLIYGESGTGKELIARAIHANSNRRDDAFFAVDCGTLSEDLLETELFGHVRGAFTGAHRDKAGIFALADGGTVFLDEISNISREVQGKLLRFLEVRELMPVGATEVREVEAIRDQSPETKVIIITGYASIDTAVEGARMGAVAYIPKPFTPTEIREAATEALQLAA
jgi:DNA-binding NtrC family response regulator